MTRCCANLLVRADCREDLVACGARVRVEVSVRARANPNPIPNPNQVACGGIGAIIGAAEACGGNEDVLAAVAPTLSLSLSVSLTRSLSLTLALALTLTRWHAHWPT